MRRKKEAEERGKRKKQKEGDSIEQANILKVK